MEIAGLIALAHKAFWFVFVLGVLIFFHELGHFLVARWFNVRVLTFSLGFGPKLFGRTGRDGTEYQVAAVPLGGYVKMLGQGDDEEIPPEDQPFAFNKQAVGPRFAIVFAGPAFNFVLAVLILWVAYWIGVREPLPLAQTVPVIGALSANMPAEQAGLQPGDRITHVNETAVESWSAMSEAIKATQSPTVGLTVARSDPKRPEDAARILTLTLTPKIKELGDLAGNKRRVPVIGISPELQYRIARSDGVLNAFVDGARKTWEITDMTLSFLWKLLTRAVSSSYIGGPLLIAEMAGERASQGMPDLMFFMAIISVNLGILNLLPIPVLDGGHLFFFTVEAVKGSPVSPMVQDMAVRVGMTLLIALMGLAFYNDIARIIQ
jgi:regulator of sigma E protease